MIERLGNLGAASPLAFWLVVAACAYYVLMAVRLTIIDVRHHLLPDRIVFPSYGVAGVLLLGAAASLAVMAAPGPAVADDAALFGLPGLRILAGGLAMWLFYFLLHTAYPPGMGFGDVKLAGVLGNVPGVPGLAARRRGCLRGVRVRRPVEPWPDRHAPRHPGLGHPVRAFYAGRHRRGHAVARDLTRHTD